MRDGRKQNQNGNGINFLLQINGSSRINNNNKTHIDRITFAFISRIWSMVIYFNYLMAM